MFGIVCVLIVQRTAASPAFALSRARIDLSPGDLISLDTTDPRNGVVVGNTGLFNVGTMDFFDGALWAVDGTGDAMKFYTIDPETAEATLESTFRGPFGGTSVFSGSFDDQGDYWVVDFIYDTIREIDPRTGRSISSVPINRNVGYNGVAFVGDVLYAVRGAFGDPPQQFGTIDTLTGVFTRIGFTGVGVGGVGGGNGVGALDYDPATGTLDLVYRSGIAPGQLWSLYTVNIATGGANFVGEIGPRGLFDAFAVVPEPTTLGLLLLGFCPLFGRRRHRETINDRDRDA